MKDKFFAKLSTLQLIFAIIGIIILGLAFSLILFTFGYWIITLILATFFGFLLPFSFWYSLGAWLIALVLSAFILPSNLIHIRYIDN